MVSVGQRIGRENLVSMLANVEAREQDGRLLEDDEVAAKAIRLAKRQRIRSLSPDLNILAYRRYCIERTNNTQYDGEILDLLNNPTPEKYAKLEPELVEDLTVVDKILDLLYKWEGMDEDSYEILPDARIICRLNMVLNGERLTVCPVPRNTTPPPALTKLYMMLPEEHEEEDNDEEEEEEENNEEED
ncbi:hypothetical protein EV426DRAFT_709146 [Tirmania nivea]|nr:hypothetical protein EV426DRAFT_709146 [Tirmania nivea]